MKIIECPRDAMQGLSSVIPAHQKAAYINLLLKVGFDTIDFGSFVSPGAVPQMHDTAAVLSMLELDGTSSKLLAIVANERGITAASQFDEIAYIGFPFSISETFQRRNTHLGITDSFITVEKLIAACGKRSKVPVIYLSMAFGNPYGDAWSPEIVSEYISRLVAMGAPIISLSDTVGVAGPETISAIFKEAHTTHPGIEFGAHLHSQPSSWKEKVAAAYTAGCRRFDGALKGYGGCPMAEDHLTGNIATENLVDYLQQQGEELNVDDEKFREAINLCTTIFSM